jgi:hypothetical protein
MARVNTVRRSDLDRVLKALSHAGQAVVRVQIKPSGDAVIFPTLAPTPGESQMNELEAWRAKRAERSA